MKRKRLFFLIIVVFLSLNSMESPSFKKSSKSSEPTSIDACRNTVDILKSSINCGFILFKASSKRFLINENHSRSQCPAHTLQLITALVALGIIGKEYQFETTLKIKGRRNGGTLYGNLYLVFSGDPTLTTFDLRSIMKALADKGIKKIKGTFYCYGSVFDEDHYAQGNNFKYHDPENNYPIDSCMIDRKALSIKRNVKNHYINADFLLNLLTEHKIVFEGYIEKNVEAVPSDAHTVKTHYSAHCIELLQMMIKSTDCLLADCFFKLCGTYFFDDDLQRWSKKSKPGTWLSGQESMTLFLEKKFNIDPRFMVMCDGSGRSSSNLMSPEIMGTLLHYIATTPAFKEAFVPVFAHRKIMKRGLEGTGSGNSLIFIRGSIAGASALLGYLIMPYGESPLIFSCMLSNLLPYFQEKNSSVQKFEKLLIKRLLSITLNDVEKVAH